MLEQDSGEIYVESHNVFKKMVFAKIVDFRQKHRVYSKKNFLDTNCRHFML
jgi:hypothetical protein